MIDELDPALPAIFTAHAAIDIAKTSSEHSMMLGDDLVLPLSLVARPEFDYVALGHVHKYQVLHKHPLVVYPGSLERIDFGEERDPKGFVTVTLDETCPRGERAMAHEFHEAGARRFLTVEVHTNGGNPNETVLRKLAARADDIRGSIVRVVIKTTAEQESLLRDDEIRKALSEAAYIASVSREVDAPQRTRLGGHAIEQLTTRQILELYCASAKIAPDRTATLLKYADELIGDPAE
jgi:exonuclease SbcD